MPSRRCTAALLVVFLAGLTCVAIAAASDRRRVAFSRGVRAQNPVVAVPPGDVTCEGPIAPEAAFEGIRFTAGTYHRPGPPLRVFVSDVRSFPLPRSTGTRAGGYPDNSGVIVWLKERVPRATRIYVCVENEGRRQVALYGSYRTTLDTGALYIHDRPIRGHLEMSFVNRESRSVLDLLPQVMRRATVTRPGWVGSCTFWVLLAGVTIAVPFLVAGAARSASPPE